MSKIDLISESMYFFVDGMNECLDGLESMDLLQWCSVFATSLENALVQMFFGFENEAEVKLEISV